MKQKSLLPLFSLLLSCCLLMLCSCSYSDFKRIPETGYLQHKKENTHSHMPFVSYWDNLNTAEWDKRTRPVARRSHKIHLKPMTLQYFDKWPKDKDDQLEIEELRGYFDATLRRRLSLYTHSYPALQIVDKPGRGVWTLDFALLAAKPARVLKNMVMEVPGFLVTGGSAAAKIVFGRKEDSGYISFGMRVFDDKGKLVAEIADFQYGMSVVGFDSKSFRSYAFQRRSIERWVEGICRLLVSASDRKIYKQMFSVNPF